MQEMKSTYANDDLSCKLLWGMDGLLSSKSLLSSDDDGDADDGDADFDELSSSKGSGEETTRTTPGLTHGMPHGMQRPLPTVNIL